MAGHKKRNSGCKCGGRNPCACMANPRKRRNPVRNAAPAGWPIEKPATPKQMESFAAKLVKLGVPYYEASKLSQLHPKSEWEDILFWANREYRPKRRNPVHAVSEDYRIGLFQGAMERGHLPPPRETSGDLKRGYSDGAKVAKAKPNARAEALGVYKATSDQHQAGSALYEAVKGGQSTLQNPRKRRNPPADTHAFRGKQSLRMAQELLDSAKKSGSKEDYLRAYAYGVSARGDAVDGRDESTVKQASALMQVADAALRQDKKSNPSRASKRKRLNPAWWNDRVSMAPTCFVCGRPATMMGEHAVTRKVEPFCDVHGKENRIARDMPWLAPKRNPSPAAKRKHLAHEKSEEQTFATMLAKLPVGVTLKAGKHRVRKLSKGFVVVDGERLTEKQAAAKIHRG